MRNRLQAEQVTSEILKIVAGDIVGVCAGRSRMADRYAGDDSDGKAVTLQLPCDRLDLAARVINVNCSVECLDARAE